MGFALPSHGNLPLERYIGSCLISSCPRSTGAPQQFSSPALSLQPRKFQKQFYSSKIALGNVNGPVFRVDDQCVPKHASGKLSGVNFREERACFGGGSFDGPRKSKPTQQSSFKELAVGAIPAVVDETVWTIGVPLIAVQPPSYLNGNRQRNNRFRKNRKYDLGPTKLVAVADESELRMLHNNRSQFSKLAVHTQGVPLIQSSKYEHNARLRNNKALCTSNSHNRVYRSDNSSGKSATSRNASKVASAQSDKKESPSPTAKVSECWGVNSDENLSCNSLENSLPRIIKPRKRRKKDRKPNASVESRSHDDNNNATTESVPGSEQCRSSVKTCPEKEKPSVDRTNANPGPVDDKDSQSSSLISKAVKFLLSDEQSALDHDSAASLENFEEILSPEESESVENISVSCQCRYCEPSSAIWNVNTRGYSPSLVSCVLPFRDVRPDPKRSSGPVPADPSLGPVFSSPNPHFNRVKFPLFSGASRVSGSDIRDSKSPLFPAPPAFKNSPSDNCRFPPPNFSRPPNPEPFRYRIPLANSPRLNIAPNLSSLPRIANVNNIPDASSKERKAPFTENKFSPGSGRICKANCSSDSPDKSVSCAESFSSKPPGRFTSPSDFTRRFGLLNVSNLYSLTNANFIDTSRPPPPIPTNREEPQPASPDRVPIGSTLTTQREDTPWESRDIGNGPSIFSSLRGGERMSQVPQTHFSSIGQPFKEQKLPASHWPVFDEERCTPLEASSELTCKESTESSDLFLSPLGPPENSQVPRTGPQNLEISSEIVTSPNGHRDIEIKFFMTSSSTPSMTKPVAKFPTLANAREFSKTLKTKS